MPRSRQEGWIKVQTRAAHPWGTRFWDCVAVWKLHFALKIVAVPGAAGLTAGSWGQCWCELRGVTIPPGTSRPAEVLGQHVRWCCPYSTVQLLNHSTVLPSALGGCRALCRQWALVHIFQYISLAADFPLVLSCEGLIHDLYLFYWNSLCEERFY